jgi:peptidoglycan hydrolase-like protein with peptidoglycan-binding domain
VNKTSGEPRTSAISSAGRAPCSRSASSAGAHDRRPLPEARTPPRWKASRPRRRELDRGPIDGDYGPATKAAVERLQTDLGATVGGRVGAETIDAFNKAVANGHPRVQAVGAVGAARPG